MAEINKIKKRRTGLSILVALVAVVAVNLFSNFAYTRFDLTNEKRFTLSPSSYKVLENVDSIIQVEVFLKGNYPSGFKKLAASTEDLLRNVAHITNGNVRYEFLSPEEYYGGTKTLIADSLDALGFAPINLTSQLKKGQQQQFVYPFAIVKYKDRMMPVTLYEGKTPLISFAELNNAESMLEYNLVSAISKISRTKLPVVGYLVGNGQPMDVSTYDLVENVLKPEYDLFAFNLNERAAIPSEFKALLLVKPSEPFTEEAKLKIDQYVMQGGNLLVFMDRLNADSLLVHNEVVAFDRNLGINDLLFKYGARVNPDLVMDLQCDFLPFDVSGDGQFEFLPWNYYPVFESAGNHVINKNLGFVAGKFVNTIDTVEAAGIKKTILLASSGNSRSIGSPALVSTKENVLAPEDARYNKKHLPVGVLLEGRFSSLYANRATQAQRDSLAKAGLSFLREGQQNSKIIIFGDGDIPLNEITVDGEPIAMGMNRYTFGTQREFPFANRQLVQNSLTYLTDDLNLIDARNKEYTVRLLDSKRVGEERLQWQLFNILLPVILIILFAVGFQYYRSRKYATKK